jgi:hypothetical protein
MRLRTSILLGYGFLIALVFFATGSAVFGFLDLGTGIQNIRKQNVRAVRETTRLIEALERQDSATLTRLLEPNRDDDALEESERQFRETYEELDAHVESPDARANLDALWQRYQSYRKVRSSLLEERPDQPLVGYRKRVVPAFERVKGELFALLNSNREAIEEADRNAQSRALQYGSWLGFLVVVALFSFVFLTRKLRIAFLDRLTQIRDVAESVEAGERQRRVSVQRDDELSSVARELNRALDRYQQLEAKLEGRERELKQLVLGILNQFDCPVTVYSANGQTVGTTLDPETAGTIPAEVASAIVERAEELFREDDAPEKQHLEFPEQGFEVALRVVDSPAGPRVGVLVSYRSLPHPEAGR